MFTGIIEDIGRLLTSRRKPDGLVLRLGTALPLAEVRPGDSIAVDGACLTVTAKGTGWFEADVSHETLSATTLGALTSGARVHLERALALGDRLGGHMVTGHVDGVGQLTERIERGDGADLTIQAPAPVAAYLVPKGSVAVAGVSLTVNQPTDGIFRVTLVPHTLSQTLLAERRPGDRLNLEADILGKYVKHFVEGLGRSGAGGRGRSGSRIDEAFLAEHGFGEGEGS